MTATDWFGLVLTVVIFLLIWVLNPKNKEKFESHGSMLLDDEEIKSEKKDG
jgi:cytochrome c oxidase cbb3-type subunit 4